MTSKPKKRFTSAEQIERAIDKSRLKAKEHMRTAEHYEKAAEELFAIGDPLQVENGNFYLSQSELYRKSAERLLTGKLKKLGQRLSEIKTPLLIDDGDSSVPGI